MKDSRRQFLKNMTKTFLGVAAISSLQPALADPKQGDIKTFMAFSRLITDEQVLDTSFGELCWRYVQQHSQPAHIIAMQQYVNATATQQEAMLNNDPALKSIAYHTLMVWYKGDLSSIHATDDEKKLAYTHGLQWKAIGAPARGICNPHWRKACTTS